MGFSRQKCRSGRPCPPPGIFPTQRLNPCLLWTRSEQFCRPPWPPHPFLQHQWGQGTSWDFAQSTASRAKHLGQGCVCQKKGHLVTSRQATVLPHVLFLPAKPPWGPTLLEQDRYPPRVTVFGWKVETVWSSLGQCSCQVHVAQVFQENEWHSIPLTLSPVGGKAWEFQVEEWPSTHSKEMGPGVSEP